MGPLLALYALQKHKQYQDNQRGGVAESKATCWYGRQLSLEPTVLPSFFRALHDPIHIVAYTLHADVGGTPAKGLGRAVSLCPLLTAPLLKQPHLFRSISALDLLSC